MTQVKFFLFMFFAFNLTLVDFASAQRRGGGMGRDGDYRENGRNNGYVTCSARTTDFIEKHILGHTNCNTCLAKHDSCTEKCTQTANVCTVEGTNRRGRVRIFTASGNRWNAEDQALNDCEYNRNMVSCLSLGCNTQNLVVSNRNCQ
ncbi:MAG TPA: hypothetical protein VNJ01_15125 [Bacteriovoracaceae bacterium]|nr:hypothetical protein [Bacteriovoracaceae bacterium]